MTTNHDNRRPLQRDARLWATHTGTNYTTAFRAVSSPLVQGILGERLSPRHLIQTLDAHPTLGDNGVNAESPFRNRDGQILGNSDLLLGVALAAEVLQMFTPAAEPATGSYSLKHVAEDFLRPVMSYVSNGQLIWAGAALGLPMSRPESDSPNVLIGISDLEYVYAYNSIRGSRQRPKAHDHQPPRWTHLRTALDQFAATGDVGDVGQNLMLLTNEPGDLRFHNWLIDQAERLDLIGDLAGDYQHGTEQSEDPIARTPWDLLEILEQSGAAPRTLVAAHAAIEEWRVQL